MVKKVLVTAGPTVSSIDPVRYITNKSSGKMGYAIAAEEEIEVQMLLLYLGLTNLNHRLAVRLINVKTNDEMLNEVLSNFDDIGYSDVDLLL